MASVPGVRLQKILAAAGVASRRAAEIMIKAGRVSVNGAIVTRMGSRADPEVDDIRLDGRRVGIAQLRRYILLNKPAGYVTTRDDPERRKTVLDLIPRVREYVYPVGRLDFDSEGLLLLTNDGDLAAKLTHPRHGIERVYEAMTRGVPSATELQKLASGIALDGRRTAPAEVRLLGGHTTRRIDRARIRVTLKEGRNRQVRRMFEAIGHPVVRLRRIRFGPLGDRGLKVGVARELSREELNALRRAVDAPPSVHQARVSR
jgi:pseudouridine synthase